jgi:uncharacterized protein YjbI with pentapeptide repeats
MEFQPLSFFSEQRFEHSHLENTSIVSNEFHDCTFTSGFFSEAIFDHCRFVNCLFRDCDLSLMQVPGTFFSDTKFEECRVIGVDWTQADWASVRLQLPITFKRTSIDHSTFIGLSLPAVQIKDCSVVNVDFRETDLSRAILKGSDFSESLFLNTDLTKADLRGAINYHINPETNILAGAQFSLPEAMSLLYAMNIVLETEDTPHETIS